MQEEVDTSAYDAAGGMHNSGLSELHVLVKYLLIFISNCRYRI